MRNKAKMWNAGEERILRDGVRKNLTYAQLAKILHRSKDSIAGKVQVLRIGKKKVNLIPWSTNQENEIIKMRSMGWDSKHISQRVRRSVHSVNCKFAQLLKQKKIPHLYNK